MARKTERLIPDWVIDKLCDKVSIATGYVELSLICETDDERRHYSRRAAGVLVDIKELLKITGK